MWNKTNYRNIVQNPTEYYLQLRLETIISYNYFVQYQYNENKTPNEFIIKYLNIRLRTDHRQVTLARSSAVSK